MVVLNWQNDPLLFDSDIVQMQNWITANKLIEAGQVEKLFLDKEGLLLDLFPILIRRSDFVREKDNDRILARFPFKVLTEEEITQINDKDLLIAEVARDYFYRSINTGVMDWRIGIKHYLERGAMPYPLVRCSWEFFPRSEASLGELTTFENAKGKTYQIGSKITKQLAYLCGVCNGDGHLNEHWLRIVDETREHIEFLSQLFNATYQDPGRLFKTGNAWNVEVSSSSLVRLIHFLTDQSINMRKYDSLREPLLFKQLGNDYRSAYWRGAMDADGSFVNQISFSSASQNYVEDLQQFLVENNIPSKISTVNQLGTKLSLITENYLKYAQLIGVLNPKKKRDFFKLLNRSKVPYAFKGIRNSTLTTDGYFDFSLLPELQIIGLDQYVKDLRDGRTYATMRELLTLSKGSYSRYENESQKVSVNLFIKMVTEIQPREDSYMHLLEKLSPRLSYQSSTSDTLQLPLKPSESLLSLLEQVDPKDNYVTILTEDETIISSFYQQFGILIKPPKVYNRLLARYLNTFFIFEEQPYKVPVEEFNKLEKKWRQGIANGQSL